MSQWNASPGVLMPRTNLQSPTPLFGTARTHQSLGRIVSRRHPFPDMDAFEGTPSNHSSISAAENIELLLEEDRHTENTPTASTKFRLVKDESNCAHFVKSLARSSSPAPIIPSPRSSYIPTKLETIVEKRSYFTIPEVPSLPNMTKPVVHEFPDAGKAESLPSHRKWYSADDIVHKSRGIFDHRSSLEKEDFLVSANATCCPGISTLPDRVKTPEGLPRWPADLQARRHTPAATFTRTRELIRKLRFKGNSHEAIESAGSTRASTPHRSPPRRLARGGGTETAHWQSTNSEKVDPIYQDFEDHPFYGFRRFDAESKSFERADSMIDNDESEFEIQPFASVRVDNNHLHVPGMLFASEKSMSRVKRCREAPRTASSLFAKCLSSRGSRGFLNTRPLTPQSKEPPQSDMPDPNLSASSNLTLDFESAQTLHPANNGMAAVSTDQSLQRRKVHPGRLSFQKPDTDMHHGPFRVRSSPGTIHYTIFGIQPRTPITPSLGSSDSITDLGQRVISASSSSSLETTDRSPRNDTTPMEDYFAAPELATYSSRLPSAVPSPLRPKRSRLHGYVSSFPLSTQKQQSSTFPSGSDFSVTNQDFRHPLVSNLPLSATFRAHIPTPSPDTIRGYLRRTEEEKERLHRSNATQYQCIKEHAPVFQPVVAEFRPTGPHDISTAPPPKPELYCVHELDHDSSLPTLRANCWKCRRTDSIHRGLGWIIRVCLCQDVGKDVASVESTPVRVRLSEIRERRTLE